MEKNSKIAIFPGTFDPFTKGHLNVVNKSLDLFDIIIIAIGSNSEKNHYFSLDSRVSHITDIFSGIPQIKVQTYSGLTADYAGNENCNYLIRGLRNSLDFNYELPIAQMNASLGNIETVFLPCNPEFAHLSSTIVRDIHKNGGDIQQFVPGEVSLLKK